MPGWAHFWTLAPVVATGAVHPAQRGRARDRTAGSGFAFRSQVRSLRWQAAMGGGLRAISPGALAAGVLSRILDAVTMAVLHSSTSRVFTNLTTARALPLVVVSVLSGAAVPLDVAMVCSYTWECAPPPVGPNEHANVLGYGVIADTFLKTYIGLPKAG